MCKNPPENVGVMVQNKLADFYGYVLAHNSLAQPHKQKSLNHFFV